VVGAAVTGGSDQGPVGSRGPHPDLPPRPGSDDVSGSPGLFPLHEGVRGFGLRHGGGGRLLRRRWSADVLWLYCRIF
jgi:hypothetical protein